MNKTKKYRKKPVEITAVQWDGRSATISQLAPFENATEPPTVSHSKGTLDITTLEGVMTAEIGDWIIKGVQGEIYPCKPDIFEQTYEAVE